eukprot:2848408-Pleurochrysis_carterae.AAC.1
MRWRSRTAADSFGAGWCQHRSRAFDEYRTKILNWKIVYLVASSEEAVVSSALQCQHHDLVLSNYVVHHDVQRVWSFHFLEIPNILKPPGLSDGSGGSQVIVRASRHGTR